jgi:hypothetical protein
LKKIPPSPSPPPPSPLFSQELSNPHVQYVCLALLLMCVDVALRCLFYFYFPPPLILLSEEEIRQFLGRGAFYQNPSLYVERGKDFKFLSVDDSRHGEWLTAALLDYNFISLR